MILAGSELVKREIIRRVKLDKDPRAWTGQVMMCVYVCWEGVPDGRTDGGGKEEASEWDEEQLMPQVVCLQKPVGAGSCVTDTSVLHLWNSLLTCILDGA